MYQSTQATCIEYESLTAPVACYSSSCEHSALKQIAAELRYYVSDKHLQGSSTKAQVLEGGGGGKSEGRECDPLLLSAALRDQQARAEVRLVYLLIHLSD